MFVCSFRECLRMQRCSIEDQLTSAKWWSVQRHLTVLSEALAEHETSRTLTDIPDRS